MPTATIIVVDTADPALGKKQGKVKDSDGNVWNMWGDKIKNLQKGRAYEIFYSEESFNDKTYNLIKNATPVSGVVEPMQAPLPLPRAAPAPAAQSFSAKDEMIFVCGALNNALANQNNNPLALQATELITFVNVLRTTWRATLGKPASQVGEVIDDEIPFDVGAEARR